MNIENNIDKILNELTQKGSEIEYLRELREKSISIAKENNDFSNVMNKIALEIKDQTEDFLNSKNNDDVNYISGISNCIYFPDFNNNGEYKIKLIGGDRSRNLDLKIDKDTMFDVASVTKLFTLLLTFKLEEYGYINLDDKIKDVNPTFKGLEDFTFNDLIRLHGDLRTDGNITLASSTEEAYQMLGTLYLASNNRQENKYTDFGAIAIGDTIEKIISKKLGIKITFKEIMEKYLFEPLNLNKTGFNPITNNLSGNGNNLGLVHDPKSRIFGGAVGHAGLFTTNDDLARLARNLFSVNYVNKEHLARLGEITFPNAQQSNKGNLGIYVKHPLGYPKTFTPPEFSTGSFSHQGWTGSVATFDPNNLIHQSILVNAIYENENKDLVKADKPVGFGGVFEEYQKQITKNIMTMYVAKQYYNKYCNVKENIDEEINLGNTR